MQLVNADPTASRISVVNKLFADTDNSPTTLSTAPATRTFTKSFDRQRRQRAFDVERRTLSSTFKQDTQCTPQLESCLQAPAASCCCHAGCCKSLSWRGSGDGPSGRIWPCPYQAEWTRQRSSPNQPSVLAQIEHESSNLPSLPVLRERMLLSIWYHQRRHTRRCYVGSHCRKPCLKKAIIIAHCHLWLVRTFLCELFGPHVCMACEMHCGADLCVPLRPR